MKRIAAAATPGPGGKKEKGNREMRKIRIVLIVVAVICFGVALSYPIRYRMAQDSNNASLEDLAAMRQQAAQQAGVVFPIESSPGGGAAGSGDGGQSASGGGEPSPEETPEGGEAPQGQGTPEGGESAQGQETPRGGESAQGQGTPGGGESPQGQETPGGGEAPQGQGTPEGSEAPQGQGTPEGGESPQGQETPGGGEAPQGQGTPEGSEAPQGQGTPEGGESAQGQGMPEGGEPAAATPEAAPVTAAPTGPTPTPGLMDLILNEVGIVAPTQTPTPTLAPTATPAPSPTPDRHVHNNALPYPLLEHIEFDPNAMLPELREIYALNPDLIGWIVIPGTVVDYPVVQTENSEFYLEHDFYGNANINGQIILDPLCDPYTPSYNLIISGHHMKNGSMFGDLPDYRTQSYWEQHKFLEFDSLMFRKQYVIFAAFYSADYDEDEEGFRYNADIRYALEAEKWLAEIRENQLYDTEIDVEFGDEFLTLTTCNRARHRNGRFVIVCRRIREGETFE